jgi:hypothetical protein
VVDNALSGSLSGLGVLGTNAEGGHIADPTQASFDQIGKVGMGSIEVSDDGKYLFVVNLFSKKLFRLILNDAYNPAAVISITSYDMPIANWANGFFPPLATKFYRGKLYVGGVCCLE